MISSEEQLNPHPFTKMKPHEMLRCLFEILSNTVRTKP